MTLRARNPEVLLISRCPPYPLSLGDRLIPHHLARQLSLRGYQIDLLAFYQEPEDQADVPYYERYFNDVTLIREPLRSPISLMTRAVLRSRRFPTRRSGSWSREMWDTVARRLQYHRVYDVVHLFGGIQVYEFRELVRRYPSIIAPYESYSLYLQRMLEQATNRWARNRVQAQLAVARRYESWMFSGYRRVVVVSDRDARVLQGLNPGLPVEVIPNGVDLDFWTPTGHEPETPTLLFTGNYDHFPNVDAAIGLITHIFPRVRQVVPEAELWIVGPNPPPQLLALQGPGVRITGGVPDLRPYFENGTVYVSPLRLGAGIKNKILEAMAMQTAVVATPLSCDGIEVTHGHNVFLARRTDELVRATIRLLQDAELRQKIAAAGRALIERQYTWRHVADAYEALYEAVIHEHYAAR